MNAEYDKRIAEAKYKYLTAKRNAILLKAEFIQEKINACRSVMPDETLCDELEISCRSANALKNNAILTLSDLRNMTRQQLMLLPNVGLRSVNEIIDALAVFDARKAV